MPMLTADLLREIMELAQAATDTSRPAQLLRAALRDLLDERERLVARIAELELATQTGHEASE